MKKLIITSLVLVILGIGFFYGYQKSRISRQSSLIQGNKVLSIPTAVTFNESTKEYSWIAKINTPTVVFEQDSPHQKLTVNVQRVPNDTNSDNKTIYLVNLQLTTAQQADSVNTRIKVLENQSFSIRMESNQSDYQVEGKVDPFENNQVKVTLKTNNS